MGQPLAFRGHRDRRETRTAKRRRTAMYGGDPYEDDVERLAPAGSSAGVLRHPRRTENLDKPS